MSSPIPSLVQDCLTGFKNLLRDTQSDININDRLNDQLGRFRIWAGNVSAHTTGRRSLQYRLRDSTRLSDAVIKYLKQLQSEVVQNASIFINQAKPDSRSDDKDKISADDDGHDEDDEDFEDGDLELFESFSNEDPITTHLSAIEDIITCLLRISMALRNPARNNQIRYGDTVSTEHFRPHDIQHVRSKFPQLGETIAGRLGTAISRHRQYIKYREEHHLKLAEGINDEKAEEESVQQAPQDTQTSAKLTSKLATTIATSVFIPQQQPTFENTDSDLESVGTATSYAETATDDKQLRPPKLPEAGIDGQPFECPLCYSIITAENERSWRQHVYEDFPPYVCLDQHCKAATRQFGRRRDWRQHMSQHDHNEANKDHTHISPPPTNNPIKCPLCEIEKPNLSTWYKHVGHHLEQLTLFALPSHLLDNDSDDEEEDLPELDISESEEEEQDDDDEHRASAGSENDEIDPDEFDPANFGTAHAIVLQLARHGKWKLAIERQHLVVAHWRAQIDGRYHDNMRPALHLLSQLYLHQHQWSNARNLFLEMQRNNFHDIQTTINLAVAYAETGDYNAAISGLRSFARTGEIEKLRTANLATTLYSHGSLSEAKQIMANLVNESSGDNAPIAIPDFDPGLHEMTEKFVSLIKEMQPSAPFPDTWFIYTPSDLFGVSTTNDAPSESGIPSEDAEESSDTSDYAGRTETLDAQQTAFAKRLAWNLHLAPSFVDELMDFRTEYLTPFAAGSPEYNKYYHMFERCLNDLAKPSHDINHDDEEEAALFAEMNELRLGFESRAEDQIVRKETQLDDPARTSFDLGPLAAEIKEEMAMKQDSMPTLKSRLLSMHSSVAMLTAKSQLRSAYEAAKQFLLELVSDQKLDGQLVDQSIYILAIAACRASMYTDVTDLFIGLVKQRRSQLNREDRHITDEQLGIWDSPNQIVTIRQSLRVLDARSVLVTSHVGAQHIAAVEALQDLHLCNELAAEFKVDAVRSRLQIEQQEIGDTNSGSDENASASKQASDSNTKADTTNPLVTLQELMRVHYWLSLLKSSNDSRSAGQNNFTFLELYQTGAIASTKNVRTETVIVEIIHDGSGSFYIRITGASEESPADGFEEPRMFSELFTTSADDLVNKMKQDERFVTFKWLTFRVVQLSIVLRKSFMATDESSMMYCPTCEQPIKAKKGIFCPNCGSIVAGDAARQDRPRSDDLRSEHGDKTAQSQQIQSSDHDGDEHDEHTSSDAGDIVHEELDNDRAETAFVSAQASTSNTRPLSRHTIKRGGRLSEAYAWLGLLGQSYTTSAGQKTFSYAKFDQAGAIQSMSESSVNTNTVEITFFHDGYGAFKIQIIGHSDGPLGDEFSTQGIFHRTFSVSSKELVSKFDKDEPLVLFEWLTLRIHQLVIVLYDAFKVAGQRDLVLCHQCTYQWFRDEHGNVCPECHSESTESIVDIDYQRKDALQSGAGVNTAQSPQLQSSDNDKDAVDGPTSSHLGDTVKDAPQTKLFTRQPITDVVNPQALNWLRSLSSGEIDMDKSPSGRAIALESIGYIEAAVEEMNGYAILVQITNDGHRSFSFQVHVVTSEGSVIPSEITRGEMTYSFVLPSKLLIVALETGSDYITLGTLVLYVHKVSNALYEIFGKTSNQNDAAAQDRDGSVQSKQRFQSEPIHRDPSDDMVLIMLADLRHMPGSKSVDLHSLSSVTDSGHRSIIDQWDPRTAEYRFDFRIRCLGEGRVRLDVARRGLMLENDAPAEGIWKYTYTTTELKSKFEQGVRVVPIICGTLNIARLVARIYDVLWNKGRLEFAELEAHDEQSSEDISDKGEAENPPDDEDANDDNVDSEPSDSSPYQQRLRNYCETFGLPAPRYNFISDRKEGRTAWNCVVMISRNGQEALYEGDVWYDGRSISRAREGAAKVALQSLLPETDSESLLHRLQNALAGEEAMTKLEAKFAAQDKYIQRMGKGPRSDPDDAQWLDSHANTVATTNDPGNDEPEASNQPKSSPDDFRPDHLPSADAAAEDVDKVQQESHDRDTADRSEDVYHQASNGPIRVSERSPRKEEHADALTDVVAQSSRPTSSDELDALEFSARKTWQDTEQNLGREHPTTIRNLATLSRILIRQGNFVEAEPLTWTVLELRERTLGQQHPDTLSTMKSLAQLFIQQKDYRAENMALMWQTCTERAFGKESPESLRCTTEVAYMLGELGNVDGATSLLSSVYSTRVKVLGQDHPMTIDTRYKLDFWVGRRNQADPQVDGDETKSDAAGRSQDLHADDVLHQTNVKMHSLTENDSPGLGNESSNKSTALEDVIGGQASESTNTEAKSDYVPVYSAEDTTQRREVIVHDMTAAEWSATGERRQRNRSSATMETRQRPLKFTDCVGRKYSWPWHRVKQWKDMEALINHTFLHIDMLETHVNQGHYDLTNQDGEIILPQLWEDTVQPGWTITMHMWPMPDLPGSQNNNASKNKQGEAEQDLPQQQPQREENTAENEEDEQTVDASNLPDAEKAPIRFKDCIDRQFVIPWAVVKRWSGMKGLITQALQHTDVFPSHIEHQRYDLVKVPSREIVLPELWEDTVSPGCEIEMVLWPTADAPLPPPPPTGHGPDQGLEHLERPLLEDSSPALDKAKRKERAPTEAEMPFVFDSIDPVLKEVAERILEKHPNWSWKRCISIAKQRIDAISVVSSGEEDDE